MAAPAVEIKEITKTFDNVTAVDRLSLSVPEGSVYGFIGPNGSGKSTTMRMIVNIIHPDSGAIRVFGQERSGTRSGEIGYLPEERGVYRKMQVRALLEFHGKLRGGRNVGPEVNAWLDRLGLAKFADSKVEALSKGMSQKVQFIATVVPEPKLLILDEPFTGLDPVSADSIRGAILEMRSRGCTIILSTHDMGVAGSLCDSIFMIFRGKKVLDGTLAAIQASYGSDTIRVEVEGGGSALGDALGNLPGIERIKDMGQVQELRMGEGCDPQRVLHTLVDRTKVVSFSVVKPSLHDIFVRIAGPQPEEAAVATNAE
ncbi:MAG: ABC transporter ATP-binding protein [Bryobacteraceae bacterium]